MDQSALVLELCARNYALSSTEYVVLSRVSKQFYAAVNALPIYEVWEDDDNEYYYCETIGGSDIIHGTCVHIVLSHSHSHTVSLYAANYIFGARLSSVEIALEDVDELVNINIREGSAYQLYDRICEWCAGDVYAEWTATYTVGPYCATFLNEYDRYTKSRSRARGPSVCLQVEKFLEWPEPSDAVEDLPKAIPEEILEMYPVVSKYRNICVY
jgi:hypothetical protein